MAVLGFAALAGTVAASAPGKAWFVTGPTAAEQVKASSRAAELDARAAELAQRQRVITDIVDSQADALTEVEAAERQVAVAALAALTTVGGVLPEAAELAAIESRQLAMAEALTGFTEARAARAEQAIRRAGLNPRLMVARLDDRSAQGGPLLALAEARGRPLDERFARLGVSLARMSTLQHALDSIPSHLPASLEFISSPFGVRSDPITGEPAVHAGLDFRGPVGAPIHAAASGTVSFAGDKGGYGNCLEITHGNGMVTRYAHMSAFKARVGQKVAAGDVVGAIGNTGRSTGPHLHFEVRINDQAVNPRPFLQAGVDHG